MEHYQGHVKHPQQIKHDCSEVVWCSWRRDCGKQKATKLHNLMLSWGKCALAALQGSGERAQVLPGYDSVCSSPRTCPGELISSLKSVWSVPNGPSSLLSRKERTQGSQGVVPKSPVLGHREMRPVQTVVLKKLLLQHQGSSNPTSSGKQGKRGNGLSDLRVRYFLMSCFISQK